ncbi:MAG: hypothetical protein H6606_01520 [Flavobacteriales bacterium]|nr:hypothetical protein [Flavobacteriales bacterium]
MHNPELFQTLKDLLSQKAGPLKTSEKQEGIFEACGTKPVMQGKQKVDGHYFATLMDKPTDVRFYFLPIYTHAAAYTDLSEKVRKMLKGKSCFHIKPKQFDLEAEKELGRMIELGIELYERDGLI